MKILFLSFYFRPDLCAGSFRNSPLLDELARQARAKNISIDVYTTPPQRYSSFSQEAPEIEDNENVHIERITIPSHRSGFLDQILSFKTFYNEVKRRTRRKKYDLVYASSSRLFTAYLGYTLAHRMKVPLYLDIRDIFVDTIKEVVKNPLVRMMALPILKRVEKNTFGYATHINLISGGFKPYFVPYAKAHYTSFTNGIDEIFIEAGKHVSASRPSTGPMKIVYAGNIGDGQGLHKIVPQAAKMLGAGYEFHIIGDGGAKEILLKGLREAGVENVVMKDPVNRETLLKEYHGADYLFIHLNDYEAFKKVLPSKIFELSVFKKPLIAGVGGYAHDFIREHLPDSLLFAPGDYREMTRLLKTSPETPPESNRDVFVTAFRRERINSAMAKSILSYLD